MPSLSLRPHLLHQEIDVTFDLQEESLRGRTTLWLAADLPSPQSSSSQIHDSNQSNSDDNTNSFHQEKEGVLNDNSSSSSASPSWKLNFHCRQVIVKAVTCNGENCHFSHLDPLKDLSSSSFSSPPGVSPTYDIEELDLKYRAGLEVTAEGELQVCLPNSLFLRGTSSGVTKKVDKYEDDGMQGMRRPKTLPRRCPQEITSRFEKLNALKRSGFCHRIVELEDFVFFEVTIEYHIKDTPITQWAGWTWKVDEESSLDADKKQRIVSGNTNHGSASSSIAEAMKDGVRCWVPCLDPPAQEHDGSVDDSLSGYLGLNAAIFDISITVLPQALLSSPSYRVVSSGILVSSSKYLDASGGRTCYSYRYINPERIPLYAIGVFIGQVAESYSLPFYGCQGQIFIASSSLDSSESRRIQSRSSPSFASSVRHTFLGFDLALRFMHKSIARRYTYSRCTVVFVQDLDHDFVSYDGFFLVNMSWLHDDTSIFMESPTHMLLLRAYLYSWLKSSFLLASYDDEHILHGSIGFLLDVYTEHTFGVEESRYRYLKQMEAVINYEKSSQSFSLLSAKSFPQDIFRSTPQFSSYLMNKSSLLMHLMCHCVRKGSAGGALDGIEIILRVIHDITSSKPLGGNADSNGAMPPPDNLSNAQRKVSSSMPPPTPSHSLGQLTPRSGGLTPFSGMPTPQHTPALVNGQLSGAGTPQLTPHSSPWVGEGKRERGGSVDLGSIAVDKETLASWKYNPEEKHAYPKLQAGLTQSMESAKPTHKSPLEEEHKINPPTLDRQVSTNSSVDGGGAVGLDAEGAARRAHSLDSLSKARALEKYWWGNPTSESQELPASGSTHLVGASAAKFLQSVRGMCLGGAAASLDESFIERWISRPGCLFLKAVIKVDSKNKKVEVILDQPGVFQGKIGSEYAYKDRININVVEEKEWQYSRRIDSQRNHSHTYNLHFKTRRGGGRKKQQAGGTDGDQQGSADTATGPSSKILSQISFQDVVSNARIGRDEFDNGSSKSKLRAVALQATKATDAVAASVSTYSSVKGQGPLVQFVAFDPDMLWTREIRQFVPDVLLIEQIYSQFDLFGQMQAMRALAVDRSEAASCLKPTTSSDGYVDPSDGVMTCGGETIPEQRLRLRALVDIVIGAQNDLDVKHSMLARCEAAHSIAQWQILHAPICDSSSVPGSLLSGENDGLTAWMGVDLLIACLRNMFMERVEGAGKEDTVIPLPNDFENYEMTYMRNSLLLSLANIKAQNGQTPLRIVEMLLIFAEYNDNLGSGQEGCRSFNDSHYCSVLLLCLCQVQFAVVSQTGLDPTTRENKQEEQKRSVLSLLNRIISICHYFLRREQIMIACLDDDGTADSGRLSPPSKLSSFISTPVGSSKRQREASDTRRGLMRKSSLEERYCSSEGSRAGVALELKPKGYQFAIRSGNGLLASLVLQCICHAEIQLSRVLSNCPQGRGGRDDAVSEPFQFHFDEFVSSKWPSQVVCSAVDAKIRQGFAKFIAASRSFKHRRHQMLKEGQAINHEQQTLLELDKMDDYILSSINTALDIIRGHSNRKVRRSAAISLLYAVQDRESPIAYQSVSLSDPLSTYWWHDTSGLVVVPPAFAATTSATTSQKGDVSAHGNRRYHIEYRNHLARVTISNKMREKLQLWWVMMESHPHCASDQVLRMTMWTAWSFLFFQEPATTRVGANYNIPKSLLLTGLNQEKRDVDHLNIFIEDLRELCFPSGSCNDMNVTENSVLDSDRMRIIDPMDSYCISDWALGSGGNIADFDSRPKLREMKPASQPGGGSGPNVIRLSRKSSCEVPQSQEVARTESAKRAAEPMNSPEPKKLKLKLTMKP